MHGWGVAQRIQQLSEKALTVGQGSLYQSLHRLEYKGWIKAEWSASENNRKAKFYFLTAAGRKQLKVQLENWDRLTNATATPKWTKNCSFMLSANWSRTSRGAWNLRKPDVWPWLPSVASRRIENNVANRGQDTGLKPFFRTADMHYVVSSEIRYLPELSF